jgi:nucleoside 2-deoxyribosyltransferase-like protein
MIIRAPEPILVPKEFRGKPIVFLAGSIEMGKAVQWQPQVEQALLDSAITLNPRRLDWDPSWRQSIDHPKFREQVEWELRALEIATAVAMYFDPNTMSPISLLELGLYANNRKLTVCCPEGYWRKGNVDVTCHYYLTRQVDTLDMLIDWCKTLK